MDFEKNVCSMTKKNPLECPGISIFQWIPVWAILANKVFQPKHNNLPNSRRCFEGIFLIGNFRKHLDKLFGRFVCLNSTKFSGKKNPLEEWKNSVRQKFPLEKKFQSKVLNHWNFSSKGTCFVGNYSKIVRNQAILGIVIVREISEYKVC